MKICYVLEHFPPYIGGAENNFFQIAQGMVKRGHKVRVITSAVGEKCGYQMYEGIDVWYNNWRTFMGRPFPKKRDLMEHLEWADIIHTSTHVTAPITCKYAHKISKKCFVTVYEVLGEKWKWIESRWLFAKIYQYIEHFIVTRPYDAYCVDSDVTHNALKKTGVMAPIRTIYIPVKVDNVSNMEKQRNIHRFFGLENSKKVFLFYGRPGQSKGLFVYLEALRVLREWQKKDTGNVGFCFLISDEPKKQRKRFLNLVKKYELTEMVRVKPSVSRKELFSFIQQADCIVVPSVTEGFGLSAVEACYMGKKLICSRGGSLPEVVFGEVVFFENRNSYDMAEKLLRVIDGDIEFEKIPPKDYSLEKILAQIEQFYADYAWKE